MKKLRNLLLVQLITGLFIGMTLVFGGILTTASVLEDQQNSQAQLIQLLVDNNVTNDPKVLSNNIKNAIDLENLLILDGNGNTLYSYESNAPRLPAAKIIEQAGMYTSERTTSAKGGTMIVRFHATYVNILVPMFDVFLAMLFLPCVIILISFILFKTFVKQAFVKTSDLIANIINGFVTSKTFEEKQAFDKFPLQFGSTVAALKKLAAFLNTKITEFEKSASELKSEAYKDSLTDLPNRTRFVEHFEANITNSEKANPFGILALLRATELQHINQSKGYQEGDKYIKGLSEVLIKIVSTYNNASIYRLNGSDFGMLIPNITIKEADAMAQNIHSRLNEFMRASELSAIGSIGIVGYVKEKPLGELLASADTAISLAQTKHVNAWHIHKESNLSQSATSAFGNQNWRQIIDDVISQGNVTLLFQPINAANRGSKAYTEVYSRFKSDESKVLPTASFLAMAEKLNRVVDIDRMIIERVFDMIKTKNMADRFFGINLTPTSVHNDEFMIWLERRLLKEANIATKLVFEISEFGLQQNVNSSRRFIDMIHRAGSRVTVEKFGVGITSFKFFQELKPDFIKLDGSYTRDIEEEKNNQYFIRMIVDLAHRIGVNVLAECVETQEEKHVLEKLFVDGCQGYYIGKPGPL
jgi:diguanylate cyclase (GGDEF)-like protein